MKRMGVSEQIKAAIQDLVAPSLHEIRGSIVALEGELQAARADIRRVDTKIDNVDARLSDKIDSLSTPMRHMRGELIAEIRRVDARIDGVLEARRA